MTGVVFDFGNVLYTVDYPRMARTLFDDRAEEFLGRFVKSPVQVAYETGKVELRELLRAFGRAGFPIARGPFLEAYLSIFDPVPEVGALVQRLAERRPLGLLSNTSPEHARLFIEKTPEFGLFTEVVYSFQVGHMKPAPVIYRTLASRLELPLSELAFTDDVEEFVAAAAGLGMAGVLFRNAGDLRARLAGMGFAELQEPRA